MAAYFRKSITAGPIRFNLSKSGIGMSAGIKGLRIGTGPRGGYVHAGRGGVYYRQSLGSPRHALNGGSESDLHPDPTIVDDTGGDNLEGVTVSELVAATPSDIVRRIQEAAALRKPRLLANPFSYKSRKNQWLADRAVPLFYELEDDLSERYEALVQIGQQLGQSPGRYYDSHEEATDPHRQYKGHGGAGKLLDRKALTVRAAQPEAVSLNFEPIEFAGPGRSLFLLPDQVLVQQGSVYAAVAYRELAARVRQGRFITEDVPRGVHPVDHSWKYLNKKGGPDRRYKENRQLPVLAVAEIDFIGPAGFEFHTAYTDLRSVAAFSAAFEALKDTLPN